MKNLICLFIAMAVGMLTSVSHAQIVYQVDRTIGAGTVTGFVTTDGTLGVLSSANIIGWELTLTSPNLVGGPSETISSDSQTQTGVIGSNTTATATDLMFDMNAAGSNYFLLQGSSGNYWCIETAGCTGLGAGEYMGFGTAGTAAESSFPTGNFVFASVATPIVYQVNRTIDQGTITGFIETDGTLGVLASANIISWELTLNAPNLQNGPTDTISSSAQIQTNLSGSTTTATATQLSFDISGGSGIGFFLLQGGNSNFWCIETANANCTGSVVGERLGRNSDGTLVAQTDQPTGNFVFANVSTPIVYQVSRTVDAGTVTGFIETDGTLGTLTSANIIDWELTLTSPNLLFGDVPTDTISFSDNLNSTINGSVVTATSTDLMFDMTGGSGDGFFLVQGGSFNYWCIETAGGGCTGAGIGEHIGWDTTGTVPAETGFPTGNFVFASVATPTVYLVSRTVGDGTVTGFIETDGTLGTLTTANITDWELTLTSPDLLFGDVPTDTISFSDSITTFAGGVITATPTDMLFDMTGSSGEGTLTFQGSSFNFWCIETAAAGCVGIGSAEHIGWDTTGTVPAETGFPTGNFVFASTVLPPVGIVYDVHRVIGDGTVTGFIETDGTLGVLSSANITNWELTLTAPNLAGGPVDSIDFATQVQTVIQGAGTTATSTSLLFDMDDLSMGENVFVIQGGGNTNYWCLETAPVFCFETGEEMGFDNAGGGAAQSVLQTGQFVFASNCPADLNGDTVLNFFDVSAFLSAFAAGDAAADFNHDGLFNFFDVSGFLGSFTAGCP